MLHLTTLQKLLTVTLIMLLLPLQFNPDRMCQALFQDLLLSHQLGFYHSPENRHSTASCRSLLGWYYTDAVRGKTNLAFNSVAYFKKGPSTFFPVLGSFTCIIPWILRTCFNPLPNPLKWARWLEKGSFFSVSVQAVLFNPALLTFFPFFPHHIGFNKYDLIVWYLTSELSRA